MVLAWQEFKINLKMLLIWAFCVGGLSLGCLLLYESVEDSIDGMAEMYSDMGALSAALGMDKVSIGTLEGYYAIEISIMLSLGGAMFAAMLGAGLSAKEEEGHTTEFLNVLPLGRARILMEKYTAFVALTALFHIICVLLILCGFGWMGSRPDIGSFMRYHGAAFFMCIEVGTVCFLLSVWSRKKPMGAAIGLAVLLYMADLMCRVVPALERIKYVTPFSYCSGADVFAGETAPVLSLGIGAGVTAAALAAAVWKYKRKDL